MIRWPTKRWLSVYDVLASLFVRGICNRRGEWGAVWAVRERRNYRQIFSRAALWERRRHFGPGRVRRELYVRRYREVRVVLGAIRSRPAHGAGSGGRCAGRRTVLRRPSLINLPTFSVLRRGGHRRGLGQLLRSNKYRIYWVPSASQWVFIPTGIDQTFVANETPVLGAAGMLFQKCLSSERCAREFQATVGDVLEQIEHMNLPARLDKILHLIGPASEADARKPYDADRMHGARDRLYGFLKRRPAEVRAALACVDEERAGVLGACSGVIVSGGPRTSVSKSCRRTPMKMPGSWASLPARARSTRGGA